MHTGMVNASAASRVGELGVTRHLVDLDEESSADRGRAREHEVVPVAPRERAPCVLLRSRGAPVRRAARSAGRSRSTTSRTRSAARRRRRTRGRRTGCRRSSAACTPTVADEHRLAEHDDREQPVALGDVARVPRRPCRPLGPDRHAQLERAPSTKNASERSASGSEHSATQPSWHDRDADRVADARRPALRDRCARRAATARPSPTRMTT